MPVSGRPTLRLRGDLFELSAGGASWFALHLLACLLACVKGHFARLFSSLFSGGALPLCAVHAVLAYLSLRGDSPGPLFLLQNGQPLSRTILTDWLRQIMSASGIPGNFSSHSFRIGAASVAARNGVPDHLIQVLGRWTSNAYQLYIRTPSEYLAGLSHCLT